jgi:UDPglucose 6-dehydrogenase
MKITVVGLGKLGSPLAAVLANGGHEVIGVDIEPRAVALLAAGQAPVVEPGLQAMIDANRARLSATTDIAEAVAHSDATYVIVPTPTAADGTFTNEFVLRAVERVGVGLARSERYHVVNITSTVMPGSTGGAIAHSLEATSGRVVGHDVGLCYGPEFIALGSVIHDMLHPDVVLIGESDPRAGQVMADIALSVVAGTPAVRRMNLVNAEMVKISINTYVTTKISFSNMLADLCERIPGADVDVVTDAMGHDVRVGHRYLRGATGYGGPCFPRDNVAFAALANTVGANASLAQATHSTNLYQVDRLETLVRRVMVDGIVGVLGLAYKPATSVIEQSQGVGLALKLSGTNSVVVHDPLAGPAARTAIGDQVEVIDDLRTIVSAADTIVITTPDPVYRDALPALFASVATPPRCVVDCWRLFRPGQLAGARLVHLGRVDDPTPAAAATATV